MRLLVNILIRQALREAPSDPRGWLESLQADKWAAMNAQNGQIIGTSVNGKTVNLQALPGTTLIDLAYATELAIQKLDSGLTSLSDESVAFLR